MKRFCTHSILFFTILTAPYIAALLYFNAEISGKQTGDLEALGGYSIEGSLEYWQELTSEDTPDSIVTFDAERSSTKYLFIGDSFSDTKKLGSNVYANYAANSLGSKAMIHGGISGLDFASQLLNSGYFDNSNVKYVVIQSVERQIANRIIDLDLDKTQTISQIEKDFMLSNEPSEQNSTEKSDKGLLYAFIDRIKKQVDYEAFSNWLYMKILEDNPVYVERLSKPLFSIGDEKLYFYNNDINRGTSISQADLAMIEEKLNKLYGKFQQVGVELIILCASDKYTAYQDYIVENPFPHKIVGDQIEELELAGKFIDTSHIIDTLIQSDVKDVYFANDSHWTKIAAKPVGEHVARVIKEIEASKCTQK